GNLRRLLGGAPGCLDRRTRDEQRVDADERDRVGAVVDDAGDGEELVAYAGALALEEPAGHFHADVRGNVADAETDLRHVRWVLGIRVARQSAAVLECVRFSGALVFLLLSLGGATKSTSLRRSEHTSQAAFGVC